MSGSEREWVGSAPDTLLGPEGSGFMLVSSGRLTGWLGLFVRHIDELLPLRGRGSGLVAGMREGRPYVENYTVDASI